MQSPIDADRDGEAEYSDGVSGTVVVTKAKDRETLGIF